MKVGLLGWFGAARRTLQAMLLVLVSSTLASAGEGADREAARALFKEGAGLVRAGELERAIQSFERSLELYPHAATYYNLGLAEQQRGRLAAAAQYLRRALERVAADPSELPSGSRRAAEERLAELDRELELERASGTAGPPPLTPLDPTTLPQATAAESGGVPAPAGQAPAPGAAVVPAPVVPAPALRENPATTRSPLLVPALGVAAAGAISTIVFGSLALAQQAELDRLCPDPSRCPAGTGDEVDELAALAIAADVSLAVALLGTGVFVYAWFSPSETPARAARVGFSGSF